MDSPKICFHLTLHEDNNRRRNNNFDSKQNNHLSEQNKLHCSLSQPLGSNKPALPGTGMSTYSTQLDRSNLNRSEINNNRINSKMTSESPMRKLKKMGWYWGSISPEYASKLLENEQDGSFLIRDSSSECYIFSMTFRLDGQVHHARIEHSKGHFSFGRSRKFFCTTIVDFIEQAIEYSHNGDLLFFLHRDPAMEGPVRFRMIPLSRMKGSSSLKHMCRFAILPYVKKDKINELCIPECLRFYLNEPFNNDALDQTS